MQRYFYCAFYIFVALGSTQEFGGNQNLKISSVRSINNIHLVYFYIRPPFGNYVHSVISLAGDTVPSIVNLDSISVLFQIELNRFSQFSVRRTLF